MEFRVIRMYSASHEDDMWYVERLEGVCGKQDYYGPFFEKAVAQQFMDKELSDK